MGIGFAVARALAGRGARLLLVARTQHVLERAVADLPGDGHDYRSFDVSDDTSWETLGSELDELHGLVCAAAVIDPVGKIGTYAPSAFRKTLETNLFGCFLAVHHCLPALRAASGSVVFFGGGGATSPLPRYDAYAASKCATVRLGENLSSVLAEDGINVNCVAPGFVVTRMHDATVAAGPEAAGEAYYKRTREGIAEGGFPASEAAELVCRLIEGVPFSGKLISAQWDPWRDEEFVKRLALDSDLGTLRRIDAVKFASAEAGK
jgi:NAD(P)-dependent dehydrogenase (short-subunit alcohol dehydrogenase family)